MISLAIFLISNTIKSAIYARKDEIAIMRNVGATNGFIKMPFMIEGMCIGILGSILPILLTIFGYKFIYEALDVRTLRQSVKETMDMVSVYSKERTYANLNFLSLISVPFILVTTVVQMGIIKLKPIWDFEKVASNKVTWMSWIFVLGVTILLTGIFFGTRRKR